VSSGLEHPGHELSGLNILKLIGPPGSLGFVVFTLLVALVVAYVWPRSRRLARGWLAAVFVGHVVLAFPFVANAIANRLPVFHSADAGAIGRLDTLVVFDGDNRRGRVQEAAALYGRFKPPTVWILGADWMIEPLVEAGVPAGVIKQDDRTGTTRGQIDRVEEMIHQRADSGVAVVASRLQMPRIEALVKAAGLPVLLFASPVDSEPPTRGARLLLPTYTALRVSRDALYELVALAYYDRQGWIRSSP
jgi:uncharacterized SAM-binding protein YcdF (DUF218 family)